MNINTNIPCILLAEDKFANRLLIESMLDGYALTLIQTTNGQEAVQAFKHRTPDLVLMDMQMPIMGGCEAARIIRQFETFSHLPHTPIIALTAGAMEGDREACLEAGMDEYVTKPIEIENLLNTIRQFLTLNLQEEMLQDSPPSG